MEEANKLIGTGKKHLVMGNVVEAVNVLQEACRMLGKKYGDTADECGEAFFWCGKALLDLARMENTVLGDALEGVLAEDEEEDKHEPEDSNIESTEGVDEETRDELRTQVYDAMAEKKSEDAEKAAEKGETAEKDEATEKKSETAEKDEATEKKGEAVEKKGEAVEKKGEAAEKKGEATEEGEEKEPPSVNVSDMAEGEDEKKPGDDAEVEKESTNKQEESADKPEETEGCVSAEEEEEEGDDAEMEDDAEGGDEVGVEDGAEGEGDATAEKDSGDEEVGNLELAWEMLEVAKVIYKRKETKEDQLMTAQAYLKLGEVSSESGNYTQALEDFQECLSLQQKHLESDSRLLAETHYQLGRTYAFNSQYRQAIEQHNSSISTIRSRLDKLTEMIEKAEGPEDLPEERKEMEELKTLLPEIQEKVEDATEGLKNAEAEAMKEVLDGGSTSSAFPGSSVQNGDAPPSSAIAVKSTNGVSSANGHASTAAVSDISHLVRKKRKPEESPVKEGALKKVKHSNDADGDAAGHIDNMEVVSK